MFCCATCPFVFCNKCIKSNLSNSYVKEIEENDDWSCFVCNKDILKHQRAQHWALRNFMTKQLEKIQKTTVQSEDELSNLLNEDASNCCPKKKRKPLPAKPAAPIAPVKRSAGSMSSGGITAFPPAKRVAAEAKQPSKPAPPPAAPKPGNQSSIVCTPDILGLLNGDNDAPQPSSSVVAPPPPLIMRNNQRLRSIQAAPNVTVPGTPPIYHNISGFQIDLNHAARQEIFRLPNGKLIQVRKQATTAPPNGANLRAQGNVNIRGPQFTIRQATTPAANILNNFIRPVRAQGPQYGAPRPRQQNIQPRFTSHNGRMVANPVQPTPVQQPPPPKPSGSTIFTQQNGTISVARAPQPDTPFGKAKIAFEDKIISGLEICQHTINKMITLSNNTSFKESRSFSDLKDLYIHLQYLFSFTSGKIKTLQEELTAGASSLESIDTASKEKTTIDELEILEEKTDVIEVLSDDEEPEPTKVKAEVASPPLQAAAPAEPAEVMAPGPATAPKRPLIKHILYPPKDALPVPSVVEPTVRIPLDRESIDSIRSEHLDDKKLKLRTLVKVEKLEDSKDVVIKQFMAKLLEKAATASESGGSSRGGTPDLSLLCPETVMSEVDEVLKTTEEEKAEELEVAAEKVGEETQQSSEAEAEELLVVEAQESPEVEAEKSPEVASEKSPEVASEKSPKVASEESQEAQAGESPEVEEEKKADAEKSDEADVLNVDMAPPLELMDTSDDGESKIAENGHKEDEPVEIPDDDEDDLAVEVTETGDVVVNITKEAASVATEPEEKESAVESDKVDDAVSSLGQPISEMTSDSPSVEFVGEFTNIPVQVKELTEATHEDATSDTEINSQTTADATEPAPSQAQDDASVVMLDESFESIHAEAVEDPIREELPKTDDEVDNKISETVDDELNKCLEAVLSGDKSVLDSDTFLTGATGDEANAGFNLLGDEANFLGDHSLMEID